MGGLSTGPSPVVHMGDLTPEDRDGLIGAVARAFADGEGPVFADLLAARVAVDTVFPLIAAQVWAERVAIVAVLSEFAPLALPHNDLPTIVRGIALQRDNQHELKDHLAEVARKLTAERNDYWEKLLGVAGELQLARAEREEYHTHWLEERAQVAELQRRLAGEEGRA